MKKLFRNLAILSVILIVGFAVVIYYQTVGADEGTFCGYLLDKPENKKYLSEFIATDVASFNGNANRYGIETKYYLKFKSCSTNSSYITCWNELAKSEIVTKQDQVEFFLATGAVLHRCSKVQTHIADRR